MRVALVGNFGLRNKMTMAHRALPLARALAARGHETWLVLPPWDSPADAGRRVVERGIPVAYSAVPAPVPLIRHPLLVLTLARAVLRTAPEALYVFKPKAYAGMVLALALLLRDLGRFRGRIVLDTDDWEGEGGWNDVEPAPGIQKRFVARHERWCLRHADAVTAASREIEWRARAVGARRVSYLPNAVSDISPGARAGNGAVVRDRLGIGDAPIVLCYTRFVEFRPARLVDTFARIHRELPAAHLVVVGRGLHGEEQALATRVDAAAFADRVHLAGWIPSEALPDYLAAADVALYPADDTPYNRSKCTMKLLDLLAAGLPTVADAVGQATEYFVDGRTGVLVPPGQSQVMADACLRLLRDPAARCRMSRAARDDVAARWTWDAWADVAEAALKGSAAPPDAVPS